MTLGQLVTSLTAFLVITVIASLLTPEEFGLYRFVLSVLLIVGIANLPGLDTAIIQSTAKGYENSLEAVARYKMKWSLWGSAASLCFAAYYFIFGNTILGTSFIIVSALLPFYGSFFVYFFYLQGRERFGEAAFIQGITRVLFVLFALGGIYLYPNAVVALALFLIGTIVSQFAGYMYVRRKYLLENDTESKADPELYAYGKKLTLLGSANIVATNIDKVITWYVLGPVATAIYTIATLLPLESIRIGRIMSQVMLPRFSKNNRINIRDFLIKLLLIEACLFICWVIYALGVELFFSIFFSQYLDAVGYTIVAGLIILTAPAYIMRSYFTARKEEETLKIVLIGIPVVKTLLLLVLIYPYGVWGAITAFVLGGVFEVMLTSFYFIKALELSSS